jgi:hypothetical protein
LWQYLWNCAGVALFLPIYSLLHVKYRFEKPTNSRIPKLEAQALIFTAIFSLLLLPVPLLVPAALHAAPPYIQLGLVLYFLTPAIFVLFHNVTSNAISKYDCPSPGWFAQPVKATYLLVGSASALTHLGIVSYVHFWTDARDLTLVSLYLPNHTIVQKAKEDILTAGALLFSQWDFIIINLTVLCHGIYLLRQRSPGVQKRRQSVGRIVFTMAILTAVLGPGAGLAFVLWSEEDRVDVDPGNGGQRSDGT